jgi:hypothetical protein
MSNRDDLIYLSRLQEQCERYDGVNGELVCLKIAYYRNGVEHESSSKI